MTNIIRPRDLRQRDVLLWGKKAFGDAAMAPAERAARVVEEAIELGQVEGVSEEMVFAIVQHVFGRPVGHAAQEVGDVSITLLAYCEAKGLSAEDCERQEFARIMGAPVAQFQKRQAEKVAAGVSTVTPISAVPADIMA